MQGHGVRVTSDNSEVVRRSNVVWIATKPHTVARVLREVSPIVRRDQLFVSVAAGTTLHSLAKVNYYFPYISLAVAGGFNSKQFVGSLCGGIVIMVAYAAVYTGFPIHECSWHDLLLCIKVTI